MGNRKRQRYLSYLVFDQQKIRYYEVFDATYPLSDAELRLQNKDFLLAQVFFCKKKKCVDVRGMFNEEEGNGNGFYYKGL